MSPRVPPLITPVNIRPIKFNPQFSLQLSPDTMLSISPIIPPTAPPRMRPSIAPSLICASHPICTLFFLFERSFKKFETEFRLFIFCLEKASCRKYGGMLRHSQPSTTYERALKKGRVDFCKGWHSECHCIKTQ